MVLTLSNPALMKTPPPPGIAVVHGVTVVDREQRVCSNRQVGNVKGNGATDKCRRGDDHVGVVGVLDEDRLPANGRAAADGGGEANRAADVGRIRTVVCQGGY